jgi:YVTN family beta-propeller protein
MHGLKRPLLMAGCFAFAVIVIALSATSVLAGSDRLPRGGSVVASIRLPRGPGGLAIGAGAVWAMSDRVSSLFRIDPEQNSVIARIAVRPNKPCPSFTEGCTEAAAGDGAVWVSNPYDNSVSRIDPQTNSVVATIPVGRQPDGIVVSPGAVWVANSGGPSVSRIDPATNQVIATIPVAPARACCSEYMQLTVGAGSIWVAVPNLGSVVRVDPRTNAVAATIHLSGEPDGFLAADARAVWVAGAHAATVVWRIDPRANRSSGAVKGALVAPIGLALGFRSLWVADLDAKTIDRVNPNTGRMIARLPVGGYPVRITVGFGSVWVRDDTGRVLRIKPRG